MKIKKFKETRVCKLHRAREIAKALAALTNLPEDIDPLDMIEIKFDSETSTAYKLRNWYEDELLEWFDRINNIMAKYPEVKPRDVDIKRLMSGLSVQTVCRLFIDEYEIDKNGE